MTQKDEALKAVIAFLNKEGFIEEYEIQQIIEVCKAALSDKTVKLPDGWVAVPVEPDRNQLDEIEKELKVCIARSLKTAARCVYKTFIKSAPTLNEKG